MEIIEAKEEVEEEKGRYPRLWYKHGDRFISVFTTKSTDKIKKDMHCMNCGMTICQYSGDILVIFDGAVYSQGDDVDVMCKRCRVIYRIF